MKRSTTFRVSTIITFALSLLLLAGCGKGGDKGGEGGGDAKPKAGKKTFISIGTAPAGGTFFSVGNGIATVVDSVATNLNWKVEANATKGTQENIRRLDKGEIEFALANAAITFFAVRGEGKWDKEYPMRSVMTLAPNIATFITPKSTGIKTLADVKGKRVVCGPAGAGFRYFLEPVFEAHGVKYDEFTEKNNTYIGSVAMLSDGSAEVAFVGGAIPTAAATQASTTQDIHFIPIEQAAKQTLFAKYPFFNAATIKAGTYKGQDSDYSAMNVGSMTLITSEAVDEETVYQFTKLVYENREEVVKAHPAGKAINPKNVIRNTGTPFHPGAIKYYKEIGIWLEGS